MNQIIIKTTNAPAPIGPYNQAVKAGNFLFVSGQIAIEPATGELKTATIQDQATQVMKNIEAILKEANYNFSDVVKTNIFLTSMNDFVAVNDIYSKYFSGNYPARETVAVAALPKNVNVEISVVAFR